MLRNILYINISFFEYTKVVTHRNSLKVINYPQTRITPFKPPLIIYKLTKINKY